jgi:hypothetical protein
MRCSRPAAIILLLSQAIAASTMAGERKTPHAATPVIAGNPLDRVAFAVDGAESSHGSDEAMWRTDPSGPQGPMQVSAAAATDVGGGDRFDTVQNREIGRAYLAQLYRRYGDWPDAIAAYNWGIGNLDAWVKAGRPAGKVVFGVSAYLGRVLHDSGLCEDGPTKTVRAPKATRAPLAAAHGCGDLNAWGASLADGRYLLGGGSNRFYSQLDKAMRLAAQHAGAP